MAFLIFLYLAAVREDRMPGGRNSGAVYNLYKVPVSQLHFKKIYCVCTSVCVCDDRGHEK